MTVAIGRPQPLMLRLPHPYQILQRNVGIGRSATRGPLHPRSSIILHNNIKGKTSSTLADVHPGDYIRTWCRENDIAFPDQTRGLKVRLPQNPFKIAVFFSRKHCIDIKSMKYFDKYEHPFARTIFDIYLAKKKAPLWYDAWAGASARPFVINTAEGKMKHAFRDALASYGYDRDGRKVASEPAGGSLVADLHGTLKINTTEPKMVCNAKFADLLEQMKFIVGVAELELRRGKDGRYLSSSSRPQFNQRGGGGGGGGGGWGGGGGGGGGSAWKNKQQGGDKAGKQTSTRGRGWAPDPAKKVNNFKSIWPR